VFEGILSDSEARLVPFKVPMGCPESEQVSRLFSQFREVYGTFTRLSREQSIAAITSANKDRITRSFEPGETVFRRMPRNARTPKHMFPPPNRGPYVVKEQPDKFNVVLTDPSTGCSFTT
jgi:hypothetical protein